MASKRKKSKRTKRRLDETAALYTEDIGTEGIKRNSFATSSSSSLCQRPISSLPLPNDEDERRIQRRERFGVNKGEEETFLSTSLSTARTSDHRTPKKKKAKRSGEPSFVGISTALEKPYLRLTDYPKPESVRPLAVLIKSLAHIKAEYIKKEDFEWTNEQLKSVRQDLTVQNIRNKFALDVYETHARILIEHGELNEFHQCQCMLQSLTSPSSALGSPSTGTDTIGGDFRHNRNTKQEHRLEQSKEATDEFRAYGLLYNLVQQAWGEINRLISKNCVSRAENTVEYHGSKNCDGLEYLGGKAIQHALNVIKAVIHDDYQTFFRLYDSPPHLSAYLMDFLVKRVRKNAYQRIIASYRPSLAVEHFREALCFKDLMETRTFLKDNGAKFIHELGAPPFWVDCKATIQAMPETNSTPNNSRIL